VSLFVPFRSVTKYCGNGGMVHCGHKYCHNGGMALAYHHEGASRGEVPGRGVRHRHLGPLSWSPGSGQFAGEKGLGVHDSRPLGSGMDTSAFLFFRSGKKYCHDGGMALAHPHHGVGLPGSKMAMMAPSRGP
jgi:hypothetical protein